MGKANQSYDVIILGGGAGGLFAAIVAAKKDKKVLVLEKSNKVGKKILMSGGGRCNFTNQFTSPENFLSKNSHFCKSALSQYTADDFIDMVKNHNIDYEKRKHGQLFCINSSKNNKFIDRKSYFLKIVMLLKPFKISNFLKSKISALVKTRSTSSAKSISLNLRRKVCSKVRA